MSAKDDRKRRLAELRAQGLSHERAMHRLEAELRPVRRKPEAPPPPVNVFVPKSVAKGGHIAICCEDCKDAIAFPELDERAGEDAEQLAKRIPKHRLPELSAWLRVHRGHNYFPVSLEPLEQWRKRS